MPKKGEQWKDRMEPNKTYQIDSVHESGWCYGNPLKESKKKVGNKEVVEMTIDKMVKFVAHESTLSDRYDLVGTA